MKPTGNFYFIHVADFEYFYCFVDIEHGKMTSWFQSLFELCANHTLLVSEDIPTSYDELVNQLSSHYKDDLLAIVPINSPDTFKQDFPEYFI